MKKKFFVTEKISAKKNGINKWLIRQALEWVIYVTKNYHTTKWYERQTFKRKALMWVIIVAGKVTTKNKQKSMAI